MKGILTVLLFIFILQHSKTTKVFVKVWISLFFLN
jgi:hypothetical protein